MRRSIPGGLILVAALLGGACRSSTEPEPPPYTHPSGEFVSFANLAGRPHGVATDTAGSFLISRIDDNRVTRGSVTETSVTFDGDAIVGEAPAHVAVIRQGTRAYTTNQFGNSVSVVNTSTQQTIATVPLSGGGFNVLVRPAGDRVYATTAGGQLHVIDAQTNASITQISVGVAANGLAYHAGSNTLYVASRDADQITAVNAANNTVTRTYAVGEMPQRIAVSLDNTELYVATEVVGLEVLDLATGSRTAVPGVSDLAVGLALSPDGVQIYVTHPPRGLVTIVDRAGRTVVRTLANMGSPRNVAFDFLGATAIITDESNRVIFVR
ncbi:MAG TPA: YncE family protein [Gemmatimonadaceae bacterium]|nr:YncE family protein [Gemmatimonadaceae bacterium]